MPRSYPKRVSGGKSPAQQKLRSKPLFPEAAALSFLRLAPVSPLEALHSPGGVYQFLLPREKGIAVGTKLQPEIPLPGGAGAECIPAGAVRSNFLIFRMNSCFHCLVP